MGIFHGENLWEKLIEKIAVIPMLHFMWKIYGENLCKKLIRKINGEN